MSEGGEARSGKHPESVRTGEGETFGERAERLGGEARNREAEVEAVARAILAANRGIEVPFEEAEEFVREWCRRSAAAAIAALDAVRCAQGRDTDAPERRDIMDVFRSDEAMQAFGVERRSPKGEDHELREKIADELAHNDECGSRHLASRAEYLADADAILRIVGERSPKDEAGRRRYPMILTGEAATAARHAEHDSPQGEDHEAGVEVARRIIDKLWAEALMCETAMLVDHVAVECKKALHALSRCPSPERDTEKHRLQQEFVQLAQRLIAAESERDAYKAALAELVRLKDHPLHDTFVEEKCAAWDLARSVLAGESSTTEE